jgi:hypothetical protein
MGMLLNERCKAPACWCSVGPLPWLMAFNKLLMNETGLSALKTRGPRPSMACTQSLMPSLRKGPSFARAMRPISRNQDTVVRAGGKHPGAQVVGPTASGRWWLVPGTAHAPSSYVSHVLIVLVETWIIVDILTPVLFFFVVCCRLASADSD